MTSNELPPIPFKVIGKYVVVSLGIKYPWSIYILYVTGKIPAGLPDFDFPKFSITRDNGTTVGFFEMVSDMGSGVIVLPIIALIENLSICKTFCQ